MIIEKVYLDFNKFTSGYSIAARRNEEAAQIEIVVTNNGNLIDTQNFSCKFVGNNPKGEITDGVAIKTDKPGTYLYTFTKENLSVPGWFKRAYFEFYDALNKKITSAELRLNVFDEVDMNSEQAAIHVTILEEVVKKAEQNGKELDNFLSKGKTDWNNFIEQNRDVLESIDPGGEILVKVDDISKKFISTTNVASTSEDVLNNANWALGTNWSGNSVAGFKHTKGNTAALTNNTVLKQNTFYQVEVTISSSSDSRVSNAGWSISLCGSVGFEMYEGNFFEHTYYRGIKSGATGTGLTITPFTDFDGTVKKVIVREITGQVSNTNTVYDENGNLLYSMTPTASDKNNLFIGKNNARFNTTGNSNVGLGANAMTQNTSGFWNVAVGESTMLNNTVGSRNVALGYIALRSNISGHRNIAIGSFAMEANKTGANNIALGADTMQANISGDGNIGLGLATLGLNQTGNYNVGIGLSSLALYKGSSAIAVGRETLRDTTAEENIAIGDQAGKYISAGERNLIIGHQSVAQSGTKGIRRNVVVGSRSGTSMQEGANFNTLLGNNVGATLTTGSNNILIGYLTEPEFPTTSFRLNIGNVLYGNLANNKQGIGVFVGNPLAALHLPASDGSVNSTPLKFEKGTLTAAGENGAIEYDGIDLYFKPHTGRRKKITMVEV